MTVKRPNAVLYFVVYILIYPLLKVLFRLRVDREGYTERKGSVIVISNHVSFMDFLLVMLAFYPRRLNAVAAQKFFYYRPLTKLLPMMGCIPKNLFAPDVRAIAGIRKVIRRGGRVLLFPEGRCTTGGAYMGIHMSTGKLMKNLNVPVISCYIDGAYTCMPFWRKGIRLGRARVVISDFLSVKEVGELSVEEINSAIDARLGGNDAPPPKKALQTFKARQLLSGLHNLLYWCPKCGSELTLETDRCHIRCAACGNSVSMDCAARLHPASGSVAPYSVQAWYSEQSRYEARLLDDDMEPVRVWVTVKMPAHTVKFAAISRSGVCGGGAAARKRGEGGTVKARKSGVLPCGEGLLTLDPAGWRFDGRINGDEINLTFPIDTVPALPFDPGDNFQIYSKGSFYAFTPSDKRLCSKYATIGECAYWRFAKNIQMTPGNDSGFFKTGS